MIVPITIGTDLEAVLIRDETFYSLYEAGSKLWDTSTYAFRNRLLYLSMAFHTYLQTKPCAFSKIDNSCFR